MSKELEFVKKIPYLLGFSGVDAERASRMNEIVFKYEIENKSSEFSRKESDDFYSRVESMFLRGLKTKENSEKYDYIKKLLAIKNDSTKPNDKFINESATAIADVQLFEDIEFAKQVNEFYTVEDASNSDPWA